MLAVLVTSVVVITLISIYVVYQFASEPLIATEVVVENNPVRIGDLVVVRRTFRRSKLCAVISDRFIMRLEDNAVMRRERSPSGMMPLGESTNRILIPTLVNPYGPSLLTEQRDLMPGRYVLHTFMNSDCGYRVFTEEAPAAQFEVVVQ